MPDIIVFHTAWMAKYDGDRASLSAGGFKFAVENGYGHEMLNFHNIDGMCYGYVPPTGNLHLEKHFDVLPHAEKLEGATVVWTAPHPEQGGRAVTGVWRNATVFREVQHPKGKLARRRLIDGEAASYLCTAKAENCVLLEPDARPIFVRPGQPRNGQSWPGQQKVFYPKPGSPALKLLNKILKNIDLGKTSTDGRSGSKPNAKRSGWQADVERRRKIEEAAVVAAARFTLDGSKSHLLAMEQALKPHDNAKWTVATYLPYLWRPDTHMFLKPEATKDFATRVGHRFASEYEARLHLPVYESLLDLVEKSELELADMRPHDRIDIQSFIWVVGDYQEGREAVYQ